MLRANRGQDLASYSLFILEQQGNYSPRDTPSWTARTQRCIKKQLKCEFGTTGSTKRSPLRRVAAKRPYERAGGWVRGYSNRVNR